MGGLKASIYFLSNMYESSTIFIKLMFPNTFCPAKGKVKEIRVEEIRIDERRREQKRREENR
jgi:hypothetical protein